MSRPILPIEMLPISFRSVTARPNVGRNGRVAFFVMMALAAGLASSTDAFWDYIWEEAKWRGAMIVIAVPLIYLLLISQ
jgi:hypothetical protein